MNKHFTSVHMTGYPYKAKYHTSIIKTLRQLFIRTHFELNENYTMNSFFLGFLVIVSFLQLFSAYFRLSISSFQ